MWLQFSLTRCGPGLVWMKTDHRLAKAWFQKSRPPKLAAFWLLDMGSVSIKASTYSTGIKFSLNSPRLISKYWANCLWGPNIWLAFDYSPLLRPTTVQRLFVRELHCPRSPVLRFKRNWNIYVSLTNQKMKKKSPPWQYGFWNRERYLALYR